jgi:hypothetical protein
MKLGDILEFIRTAIEDVTYKEFKEIIIKENPSAKASESTLKSYKSLRADQIHGGAELYKAIESLYGIDMYQSVTGDPIVVVDPTKLKPDNVQLLRGMGATFQKFPLFDKHIPPFERQEKYPAPFCLLPSVLCKDAEIGIQVVDNNMAPAISKGDYVHCGKQVNSKDIKLGQVYLVSFDNRSSRTFKIGRAEKKGKEIVLVQAKQDAKPVVIPEDAVKGIYKVVGQHRGEAGINQ